MNHILGFAVLKWKFWFLPTLFRKTKAHWSTSGWRCLWQCRSPLWTRLFSTTPSPEDYWNCTSSTARSWNPGQNDERCHQALPVCGIWKCRYSGVPSGSQWWSLFYGGQCKTASGTHRDRGNNRVSAVNGLLEFVVSVSFWLSTSSMDKMNYLFHRQRWPGKNTNWCRRRKIVRGVGSASRWCQNNGISDPSTHNNWRSSEWLHSGHWSHWGIII